MAEKDVALTPMMRQFYDLKAKHPDAVLLFRCGDFYPIFLNKAQKRQFAYKLSRQKNESYIFYIFLQFITSTM